MKIRITADSTCDLTPELLEKYDIGQIPLYVVMNGEYHKDNVDIHPQDIYSYTDSTGKSVSTAAINVEDYMGFFTSQKEDCDALIHFCISSEMSSCWQNAVMAAKEVGNCYAIDSTSLSTGIGQLVLMAAEMAQNGADAETIVAEIEKKKEKLDVSFILSTLSYLHKGGRCSAVAAFGANLMNLKPCIEVKNGKMGVGKKYRGNLQRVLGQYVKDKLADASTVDTKRCFITDSGVDDAIRQSVKEAVLSCVPFEEVLFTTAGSTISSHCGPGTLGILFFRK